MRYIYFILICITILAGAEVATIVTSISPDSATAAQLWIFFVSVWIFLSGSVTFVWHWLKQQIIYRFKKVSIWVSLRQASLTMGLIVLAFFLNTLHILTLWDLLPLAISTVLIEFFFQADTDSTSTAPHGSSLKS